LTKAKIEEAGIPVTKALEGTSVVKKYIEVFRTVSGIVPKKAIFLLDNDKGISEFGAYITKEKLKEKYENFSLYELGNGVFIILLPQSFAVEDLFNEFEDEVEDCVKEIYHDDFSLRDNSPSNLSRATSKARDRGKLSNIDDAKKIIRNQKDVKDRFWIKIEANDYIITQAHSNTLKTLIEKAL
jgi:hypothetical protein